MSREWTLEEIKALIATAPGARPGQNLQVAPWGEFAHKNNCVFWPRKERFYAVERAKVSQAVVEEIATIAGWRAADSKPETAWIWWVVHLRKELGIPILQNGHGHRLPDGKPMECLSVVWISGPGEGGQTSVEKMKKFAAFVKIQESDIEEIYGDDGCTV